MKMKRNLIILGIVAVIAIAFAVVAPNVLKPTPSPTATPVPTEDPALLSISAVTLDKVSEVTVENAKETYTVYKNGENYCVKGRESLNLDQTAATSVLSSVATITAESLVAQNPPDLSVYGLDKPQAKAYATYTDGTKATYLIGNMTAARNSYYFMKEGDSRVVTVWQNIGNTYLGTVDSMIAKQALTVTKDNVSYVKVVKKGVPMLEMSTDTDISGVSITKWTIIQPWKRTVDTNQLEPYLTSLFGVAINAPEAGEPKDLAKYGLDKPVYELTVKGDGKTDVLLIGSDKDTYSSYVKFGDKPAVYTVDKSTLGFLSTPAYKLMDKMIILVNIQSATGVQFDGLGQRVKLDITQTPQKDDKGEVRKNSDGTTLYDQVFSQDGKPVTDEAGRTFYEYCISLSTHSEIDKSKLPAEGTAPVVTVTYTRSTDPKQIKVEFLPYDQDFYAVRYNGSVDFLIKQSQLKDIAAAAEQLKNGTLATPTPSNAASPTPAESAAATAAPAASAQAPANVPDGTGGTVMLIIILAGVVVAGILLMVVMKKKK